MRTDPNISVQLLCQHVRVVQHGNMRSQIGKQVMCNVGRCGCTGCDVSSLIVKQDGKLFICGTVSVSNGIHG